MKNNIQDTHQEKIKYDTIDFKIKKLKQPWGERDCCVILINGKELLPVIREKEVELFKKSHLDIDGAGTYNYLAPQDLFISLKYADFRCGFVKVPILCCTCDEVGCASVKIEVLRSLDYVSWTNFESLRENWKFGLEFRFKPEEYGNFMEKLKCLYFQKG